MGGGGWGRVTLYLLHPSLRTILYNLYSFALFCTICIVLHYFVELCEIRFMFAPIPACALFSIIFNNLYSFAIFFKFCIIVIIILMALPNFNGFR